MILLKNAAIGALIGVYYGFVIFYLRNPTYVLDSFHLPSLQIITGGMLEGIIFAIAYTINILLNKNILKFMGLNLHWLFHLTTGIFSGLIVGIFTFRNYFFIPSEQLMNSKYMIIHYCIGYVIIGLGIGIIIAYKQSFKEKM